jgi:hypothetical protein
MEQNKNQEFIRIANKGILLEVMVLTVKEVGYFIDVSPSLNVSGYGKTKKEARESFVYNLEVFCKDFIILNKVKQEIELVKLGFKKQKFATKNYSKLFIDKNGVLKGYEGEIISKSLVETEIV